MSERFTTDVVLSDEGRELTLSGPKTGTIRLRYDRAEDAQALYGLFQSARRRCWEVRVEEVGRGHSGALPGEATQRLLAEIVTLTEVAIEGARTVVADDPRINATTGRRARRRKRHALS